MIIKDITRSVVIGCVVGGVVGAAAVFLARFANDAPDARSPEVPEARERLRLKSDVDGACDGVFCPIKKEQPTNGNCE